MKLNVGDTLVYPHHGAVTVIELKTRPFNSVETKFVRLQVHHNGLMIELPAANADKVGIRRAIGSRGVKRVLGILGSPVPAAAPKEIWSQRFKTNQAKVTTGDVFQVSEVVRDLTRRAQAGHLSAGEKHQREEAMQILVSELAVSLKTDEVAARALIEGIFEPAEQRAAS
ncbi:CarD family transcriptional regulator [Arthrobacter mobilis]|uniref:CarD family transcriptional regulator n=1 Tax=Arthrobacter mobilis TaxID=2724944 RepID=A0A7X6K495_9MICC|nr:CarD family transcriptional regulator [Arthrobacter mobilis]NKX52974.1 CarD family transcriptional regulator [Arthrobacter mobilis]